ncbi:hypothetical protein GCK32_013965 [Trichostrongylus colubriformis]|uniref:Uncharacterized protein n=1 Tax=Trichostrongylus colubriformis TaxID=6319 RepID=A0AAN8FNH4_TRICO
MEHVAEVSPPSPRMRNHLTTSPISTVDSWNWVLALTVLLVFTAFGILCICLRSRLRKYLAKVKEQEEARKAAKRAGQRTAEKPSRFRIPLRYRKWRLSKSVVELPLSTGDPDDCYVAQPFSTCRENQVLLEPPPQIAVTTT